MGYGFVDQGILSSKLVQARTAPKLCYRQHDVEAELHIYLSMSDKKIPPECDEDYPCQGLGEHAHFRWAGLHHEHRFLKKRTAGVLGWPSSHSSALQQVTLIIS